MNVKNFGDIRFHGSADRELLVNLPWGGWNLVHYGFDFQNFDHPLVGELITRLNTAPGDPVAALLDPTFLAGLERAFFADEYTAGPGVSIASHDRAVALDHQQAYANYNWELLYHIPVAVAVHLSHNQRFAEAQKWFHYVFDPTSTERGADRAQRFWKFLYFRTTPPTLDLAALLTLLTSPSSGDGTLTAQQQDLLSSYHASVSSPFNPFAVARPRPVSFQYYVVMSYLDNLIAWGDSLFAQMTVETTNEATLCYVLAANLLGPRPQPVPPIGRTPAKSYNELRAAGPLDALGDALIDLEAQFPFNITTAVTPGTGAGSGPLLGMGRTLYFCIPQNAKLLGYWDLVEDRLTKIRSGENLAGQVRLMPLFDPPIDPGMLVKATAAGLDLGSVVAGLNQPTGALRAPLLIQKALELAGEVRALGAGLLAAIEKGDAEALAALRQANEVRLQQLAQGVRYLQWQQAKAATDAVARARESAYERYAFYLRLLGREPDADTAPATVGVNHDVVLTEDTFDDAYNDLVARYDKKIAGIAYPRLSLAGGASAATQSGASGGGSLYLDVGEDAELHTHLPTAQTLRLAADVNDTVAAVLALIPDLDVDLHYWGLGAHSKVFGGDKLSAVARIGSQIMRTAAAVENDAGTIAARTSGYRRRADDWLLQANLAARELSQNGRQLLTSVIAEQAAHQEYESARTQSGQAQEVLSFLQDKFSNTDLYGWLQGQLSGLYYQYYRFAMDTARRAEATAKWELMRPELDAVTYVAPNYFDSGHKGLLAGEALQLDVKRLDLDYHTYNLRELELTKHVSLRQLDPLALLLLRTSGACTVTIPEWLYDRDCPGHYLRRMKSLAVSIPSVVGPYTNVHCTVTLQQSTIRTSPMVQPGKYARQPGDDQRFLDHFGSLETIVTSGAASDSGLFETNLRDERFLPFENAGAISTWTLTLPEIPAFDYGSIADVILHVRYTARDGGAALAEAANTALHQLPPATTDGTSRPLALLLNLRHDFPTAWQAFVTGGGDFAAPLPLNYFPYAVQGMRLTLASLTLYTPAGDGVTPITPVSPDATGLATMSQQLHDSRATTLTLPGDGTVLTRDLGKEVFAVLTYTATRG